MLHFLYCHSRRHLDDVERDVHLEAHRVPDFLHKMRRETGLPVLADAEVKDDLT